MFCVISDPAGADLSHRENESVLRLRARIARLKRGGANNEPGADRPLSRSLRRRFLLLPRLAPRRGRAALHVNVGQLCPSRLSRLSQSRWKIVCHGPADATKPAAAAAAVAVVAVVEAVVVVNFVTG